MALPAGITTATVLFGKDFDVLGGGNDVTLRITPSHTLIWEATGDRLTAFDVAVSAESDTVGTFELPHTDQAGFINEAGAEITDWWYTIVGTVRAGRAQKTYTKRVQVTSDVTSFDLDTLPINTPVGPVGSVPLPTLTSVNGQTGAVVLTASAIGAIPNTSEGRQALAESTELSATIAEGLTDPDSVIGSAAKATILTTAGSLTKTGDAWWDQVFAAPAADDTPVVTVGTSGLIVGGTSIVPTTDYHGDTHFRYDGCAAVYSTVANMVRPVHPSAVGTAYDIAPEFVTSPGCASVEVKFTMNSGGTSLGLRVIVDGKWLTLPQQWFTTTALSTVFVRLVFPTAKARHIKVQPVNVTNFAGVVVPAGETVTRPQDEVRRMVIVGDSYTSGANANTTTDPATNGTSRFETFPNYVAALLGFNSVLNLGSGGTGWVNTGGGKSVFGQRAADVLAAAPQMVLAAGSRNDSTSTAAAVYAAAVSALGPLADIPVLEVMGLGDVLAPQSGPLNAAVKAGALAAGRPFHDMLGVITAVDKNAADTVHPSALGMMKLARAYYASLDQERVARTVTASLAARVSVDLTLTVSPIGAAASGAEVTLTATQSNPRAGTVQFFANGTLLGTSTVSGGTATYTTSSLPSAAYTFTSRFMPANPASVKPSTSNAISGYNVSANLGFSASFATDQSPVTTTDNGKPYIIYSGAGAGTGGTWEASGGKLINSGVTAGFAYCLADAGTANGTFSVTLGGTTLGAARIVLRAVDSLNLLSVESVGGQIVLRQVVSNITTTLFTGSGGAWAAGDTISVVLSGDTITVKKNGTNVPGLIGVTVSQFNTATRFGVGHTSAGNSLTYDDLALAA